jgi:hypothetical protein
VRANATEDTDVSFKQVVEKVHQGFFKAGVGLLLGRGLVPKMDPGWGED